MARRLAPASLLFVAAPKGRENVGEFGQSLRRGLPQPELLDAERID
jgi:hypothetical protein